MKTLVPAIAAIAAVGMVAAAPAAAVTTITLTGTAAGADLAGLFGAPGTDITGLAFTAQYSVDFDMPGATSINGANVYGNDLQFESGAQFGAGAAITATLAINGHSISYVGNDYGVIVQANRFSYGACVGCYLYQGLTERDPVTGATSGLNFVTGGPYDPPAGTDGFYTVLDYDVTDPGSRTGNFNYVVNGATAAYGALYASHVAIATAAPVPEPGEWAMMLGGLSLLGVLARRRQGTRA